MAHATVAEHEHEAHAGKQRGAMPDHTHMLEQHHRQWLWVPLLVAVLGAWLISSPFILGYTNAGLAGLEVARVTATRNLAPIASRSSAMLWSDVLSGAALVVLAFLWLIKARRLWAPWAASFVGVWLLFAPLVFWAPTAGAYGNDTLIGVLVIAQTVLIPGMPGMMLIMQPGPEVPPGWSYNPSAWLQRAPIIALGWIGFVLSRHLAAYQLGYVDTAWDPIFGDQTMRILDSDVSRAWPISDAGLGTVAYALEALMGYMGGSDRWRTMPWMVTFFGILVIPLGTVSIVLVMMQPVAVGAWCTLCLVTALAMLIMIPLTLDEVVAMLQFLARSRREGKSLWRTFWLGGTVDGGDKDARTPRFTAPLKESGPAMVWGVSVPWPLALSAALGILVMGLPAWLGIPREAATTHYIGGALVTTVAVIAMAEVGRALRFVNVLFGAWIVGTAWTLGNVSGAARWIGLATGIAVIVLSIPRGVVREVYGRWQRVVV
ncbi:MAG: vitamin K epoxide reductase family protein [Gemmatimonadota bacterium]